MPRQARLDIVTRYEHRYENGVRVTLGTDPEGKVTRYEYDRLDRLAKVTYPLTWQGQPVTVEYGYGPRGNLQWVQDPRGGVTRYEYDRVDRLTAEYRPRDPDGSPFRSYSYDDTPGQVSVTMTDAKGQRTARGYDVLGRIHTVAFIGADGVTERKVRYERNEAGSVKEVWIDEAGAGEKLTMTFTYDDRQRKLTESVDYGDLDGDGADDWFGHQYTYYANGRKKSFTGPDGVTYAYTYGDTPEDPRLVGITYPNPTDGTPVTITYGAYEWQRPGQLRFPGNVKRRYTFDPLQRFMSIEGDDPGDVPKLSIAYGAYTPAGNVSTKTVDGLSLAYGYDELYRLTGVTSNDAEKNETFTYDPNGNRLTLNGGFTWTYDHDEAPDGIGNNELRGNGTFTYQHDANGNLVLKFATDGTTATRYVYNAEDRLIRVEDIDPLAMDPLTDPAISTIATYGYDPFGRRLWKDVGGIRTYYAYADEGLVAELDVTGTLTKTYGWQLDGLWGTNPLFQKIGTNYYWYLNDHLGTPQKMVDEGGAVVWEAEYEAFGKAVVGVETIENNLRFPGQYWDGETGLHYNWYRYYDSTVGRYSRVDPIGFGGGSNWYVYAENQPSLLLDPLGLIWVTTDVDYHGTSNAGRGVLNFLTRKIKTGWDPGVPMSHPSEYEGMRRTVTQEWQHDKNDPERDSEHTIGATRTFEQGFAEKPNEPGYWEDGTTHYWSPPAPSGTYTDVPCQEVKNDFNWYEPI